MRACRPVKFKEILEVLRSGLFIWCRKCGSRSVTHHNYRTCLLDPQDGEGKIFVEEYAAKCQKCGRVWYVQERSEALPGDDEGGAE